MEGQGGDAMSLSEADKVYQHADCVIEEQPVHHSGVHSFMRAASAFLRGVGELESSDLWRQACVEIRRVRWLLGTVPVPLNSLDLRLEVAAHSLASISAGSPAVRCCAGSDPPGSGLLQSACGWGYDVPVVWPQGHLACGSD